MLKDGAYQHIYMRPDRSRAYASVSASPQNEARNSSKSFSVISLRFPRGTVGVLGLSSSIKAEIEDEVGS